MIFIAIALFILHAVETEGQLISTAFYNLFEGEPTPKPVFIPTSRLCIDHPVKQIRTKEDIISWLLSNYPKSLPSKMLNGFYLDDEWKVRYKTVGITQKESEYVADFWNWSDALARSLK